MPASPPPVSRLMVGVCALLCGLLALGRFLSVAEPLTDPLLAAAWRVGIVMGALWLVLPAKGESWVWSKIAVVVIPVLLVVALRGRILLVALPIAAVVGIAALLLRPKPKRRRYDV
jgi:hypothetical protein